MRSAGGFAEPDLEKGSTEVGRGGDVVANGRAAAVPSAAACVTGLCPSREAKSKPETRPGVFGEPWDASWLWFATFDGKGEPWLGPQVRCNCKWIQLDCASLGDLDLLLVELYLGTGRSASPR